MTTAHPQCTPLEVPGQPVLGSRSRVPVGNHGRRAAADPTRRERNRRGVHGKRRDPRREEGRHPRRGRRQRSDDLRRDAPRNRAKEGEKWLRTERYFGKTARRFALPQELDETCRRRGSSTACSSSRSRRKPSRPAASSRSTDRKLLVNVGGTPGKFPGALCLPRIGAFAFSRPAYMPARLSPSQKAEVLIEALPYIRQFHGNTIVIKYGGNAMTDVGAAGGLRRGRGAAQADRHEPRRRARCGARRSVRCCRSSASRASSSRACASPTRRPSTWSRWCWAASSTRTSSRSSTRPAARRWASPARTAHFIHARKLKMPSKEDKKKKIDVGLVGEIVRIDPEIIQLLDQRDFIPVIAPIGSDENGVAYNINADVVAGKLADHAAGREADPAHQHHGRARQAGQAASRASRAPR